MGDIRDEWKLDEIKRTANEALRKANEIDSLRSTVDSLERANRELSGAVDGIRHELQAFKDALVQATQY